MNFERTVLPYSFVAVLTACAVLPACGEPTQKPVADAGITSPDAAAADVEEIPAVMCPVAGQLFCGEKCLDVSFDMDHCGECNNRCTRGEMTCMMGECLCLGDALMCDGACHDPQTSRAHCGTCGNACSTAEACVSGSCVPIAEDPILYGVLVATNEARAAQQDCGVHGLRPAVGPVELNERLTAAAQAHAEDMAQGQFMDHTGSDGSTPAERAQRAGYAGLTGENVARGYETPTSVVAGWVDSDGHCNNLMEGDFDDLGVGYAKSVTGEAFWVQLFGDP